MEAEKSHNLSVNWRTREAGAVNHSEPEGLRTHTHTHTNHTHTHKNTPEEA